MRIVIIEDEAPAAEALERGARQCEPTAEIVARLGSVAASVAWFRAHPPPDLVLCDVQLSDGISLDIFEHVRVDAPVVFCTAYDEYWMEALSRGGVDYVLKPIEQGRLCRAFDKIRGLQRHFVGDLAALAQSLREPPSRFKQRLVVKRGLDFVSLAVGEIAYFTTEHKLVVLVDRNGGQYVIDRALADIADELDPATFFRASRRHLIAFGAIRSYRPHGKGRLALDVAHAAAPVVVSQENARRFREWFDR